MRRVLPILLLLSLTVAYSQNTEEDQRQEMSLRQQLVWPTTPEASSLGEYGDIDVNLYTGTANLSLAGPVLQGNHISMPVSLNYATGGNKVEDTGTWVGLGWSLVAGGSITRSARNVPDTKSNYYDKADSIALRLAQPAGTPDFSWYQFYKDVARNAIEVNHDIYYYSFNGRSGKFYISPYKEIYQATDSDLKIAPVFDSVDEITSFLITDEYGHRYLFDVVEQSRMQLDDVVGLGGEPLADDGGYDPSNTLYDRTFNSTWHLSEISSYGDFERIALVYDTISGEYEYPINPALNKSRTFTSIDVDGCCGGTAGGQLNEGNSPALSILDRKYLQSAELYINEERIERLDFVISDNSCTDNVTVDATDRRLDRINVSRRDLDGSDDLTRFIDYRFTYDCSTNRLTLKTFGETTIFADQYYLKPPYSFEYIDALPSSLTSTSIDHWGYYNGATNGDNLIPSYSSPQHSFNGANRNVNPSFSDHGSLYRIDYPTGGYSLFDYSSNTRAKSVTTESYEIDFPSQSYINCTVGPGEDCCNTTDYISNSYSFTPDAMDIANGFLIISSDSICGSGGAQMLMGYYNTKLSNASTPADSTRYQANYNQSQTAMMTGTWIGGVRITATPTSGGPTIILIDESHMESAYKDTVAISALTAGISYTLEIAGYQTIAEAVLYERVSMTITTSENIGGIRIASITNHESGGALLTQKNYSYANDQGHSTGRLMNEPNYERGGSYEKFETIVLGGCTSCCAYSCENVTVSATSRSTLGTTQGSIVGYDQVSEIIVSTLNDTITAGKTVHYYHNVPHSENNDDMDHRKNGHELKKEIYHADGRLLLSEEYSYAWDIADNQREESFWTYRIVPAPDQDNKDYLYYDDMLDEYKWTEEINEASNYDYIVSTTKYKHGDFERMVNYTVYRSALKRKELFYDGMSLIDTLITEQSYVYGDTAHLQMTQSLMTNSDGTIHEQHYRYLNDYSINDTISDLLIAQQKLLPAYQVSHVVGSDTLDATRYIYDELRTPGSPLFVNTPMVTQLLRYERSWDANQMLQDGQWITQSTIDGYEINKGLIAQITDRGWIPRSYSYNLRGQPLSESFGSYRQAISYDPDSHLMVADTAIDGTVNVYTYDLLRRLQTATDPKGVVNTLSYHYGTGFNLNHVKTTMDYPSIGDVSDPQEIVSLSFFDGIGRQQQVKRYLQDPNDQSMSILTQVAYDEMGRAHKAFEPYSQFINENGYEVSNQDQHTFTQFENSPLSRQEAITPPSWQTTTTSYGTNVSGEVTNHQTSSSYAPGTLYKVSTTDPEGQVTEKFSDKRGNLILSRVKSIKNTTDPDSIADTYMLYDLKDRPYLTLPPQTSLSDTNLIHRMVYSGDDLPIIKDDPDCEPVSMIYDDRDLLIYRQDGERQAEGRWYGFIHDQYGNVTYEGFAVDSSTAINDTLISNSWGDTGIEKGKLIASTKSILNESNDNTITQEYEYDSAGRLIITRSNSILYPQAGSIIDSLIYDSQSNIVESYQKIIPDSITIKRRYTYDHIGRQKKAFIQITTPEQTWPEEELSEQKYTHKEQIKSLSLGAGLQVIDYQYLEHGLLTEINDPDNMGSDLFAMKLGYNSDISGGLATGIQTLQDGNISHSVWRTAGGNKKAYSYGYNHLKMLTNALYFESGKNGTYDVAIGYADQRGNPSSIVRYGVDPSTMLKSNTPVDNMSFSYYLSTNRIKTISEGGITFSKSNGYKSNANDDYDYNQNGAVIHDPSRVADFSRNHLNLPHQITIPDSNGMVIYYYTADGSLQRQEEVRDSVIYRIRDYIGGIEYLNGSIDQIKHDNGYVTLDKGLDDDHLQLTGSEAIDRTYESLSTISERIISSPRDIDYRAEEFIVLTPNFEVDLGADFEARIDTFEVQGLDYHYFAFDHLGSVRAEFKDSSGVAIITSEHHFYPFGYEMLGDWMQSTKNNHRYTGQERQYSFDLGYQRYDFRFGDPLIAGRFLAPDPLANFAPHINPYRYGFNNPVSFTDPFGLFESRSAAKDYAKEHGIRLGLFSSNRIVKQSDGSFAIENRKNHSSIIDDPEFGVSTGISVASNDVINSSVSEDYALHNELRDGSTEIIPATTGTINAGPGGGVKSVMKITTKIQKHHLIPRAVFRDMKGFLKPLMKLDDAANIKKLPTPFHGNHPQYSNYVRNILIQLERTGKLSKKSIIQLQKDLRVLINDAQRSGKKLNDYFRKYNQS